MNDFYIGYLPAASPASARRMRMAVAFLLATAFALALALTWAQRRFDASHFAFAGGAIFRGVIEERPVPILRVARPGVSSGESRYVLVAPGKHGAAGIIRGFDGKVVELKGMLIYRENATLIEVVPGSLRAVEPSAPAAVQLRQLGARTLTGEIVDTKCYAGVMNPGKGKVHRACAARCISGGVPAALLSEGQLYYLVAQDDRPLTSELRDFTGRRVRITGDLVTRGETSYLRVAAQGLQREPKD